MFTGSHDRSPPEGLAATIPDRPAPGARTESGLDGSVYTGKMMKRCLTFIVATVCCVLNAFAFEPHFITREFDETFSHLEINLIYQDRNCMVWFGTSGGLLQYTGVQYIEVPFQDTAATPGITALFQDASGMLWIGTESGNIYHYRIHTHTALWEIEEGLPKKQITGFIEDANGQIWISTYGEGLYVYAGGRLYNFNDSDRLLGNDIYQITQDGLGRIWAATDHGISICSFDGKKHTRSVTKADGLPDQIIRSMVSDHHGNIWIGAYEGGIAYYDVRLEKITKTIRDKTIGHIHELALYEGIELWIGTMDNGLWRYDLTSGKCSRAASLDESENSEVADLLTDVEGNLWVISGTNIIHTAYRPFELLDAPVGYIQSILFSAPDILWLGTDSGLYMAQEDAGRRWHFEMIANAPFTSVAALDRDQFGNIWIGALDTGLSIYNPRTAKFHHIAGQRAFENNPVISFFIRRNEIWLATLGSGIIHARIQGDITRGGALAEVTRVRDENASHNFVFQIMPKDASGVLLATDGAGVLYTEGDHFQMLGDTTGPHTIYSMTRDDAGHLWVVTPEVGLEEFDGLSYHPLGIDLGLRSITISSLVTSQKGELLVTHHKGIDLLIPGERHFMYFDDEIGLKTPVPVLNAVYRDQQRAVWIGLENRIIKYTSLTEDLSIHPRTWISQVSVNQEPIDILTETEFPAFKNFFAFEYVGLWYTSPQSVKYLYTLEGHDLEWKESSDHLAIYSNLKPGKYRFRVRASENKFFSDEPLAEYAFVIKKPYWQQFWFVALVISVIGGLLYAYMKNREARLRRIEELNKEKIESQFRALKAQINPHFLFNSFNTLITIIDENTENPDVPIKYVEKLSDFYRSILQYREEEAISIPEEIHLVQNYYYLLQKRYGDNLILDIRLSDVKGFVPPLVLQMLVENAVKHNVISKSHPLTIRIYSPDRKFLVVENNIQKKLSSVVSTRFGLQNIIKRYQLISDRKVTVEETDTVFRVSLPIIQID